MGGGDKWKNEQVSGLNVRMGRHTDGQMEMSEYTSRQMIQGVQDTR